MVFHRYGIRDSACGVVATGRSFMQAQALALIHAAECASGAEVEFFDREAMVGRPCRWTPAGGVKEYQLGSTE